MNARIKDPSKGLDLFQVCDFCAKQDFEAVDLTGYFFPGYPKAPDRSYSIKLKRHAFDLGLDLSGTGVRNDFTAADMTGIQLSSFQFSTVKDGKFVRLPFTAQDRP